jgi:hypothetical protein
MGAAFSHRRLLRVALVAGCLCAGLIAPASSYAFPPVNLGPPSISGTAQVGQTLTEGHGAWVGGPLSYSYQWMRCTGLSCAAIPQATAQTYAPVAEDVGHKLKVEETANNFNGSSGPAESSSTGTVLPTVPELIVAPYITGLVRPGQTLTVVQGTWTSEPTNFSYQWLLCNSAGTSCTPIAGATGMTYVTLAEDVGHKLRVTETASNAGGSASPAEAAATTAALPLAPENVTPPTITGLARAGQTLTEVPGSWTGLPSAITYQWLLCDSAGASCAAIPGATAQTYVPLAADAGRTLRVAETESNAGGAGAQAQSAPTAVQAVPVPVAVAVAVTSSVTNGLSSLQVLPARLVLSVKSVTIRKNGIAPVSVRCPSSASSGCKGTLTIRLVEAPVKGTRVVAARCGRGCRPLGGAKYEARAGQRLTVRVHIASYGHGLFKKHRVLRVTLTAMTFSDGQTATSTDAISLKAPPRA